MADYEIKDARNRKQEYRTGGTVNPYSQNLSDGVSVAEKNKAAREKAKEASKSRAAKGNERRAERKRKRELKKEVRAEKREKIRAINRGEDVAIKPLPSKASKSDDIPAPEKLKKASPPDTVAIEDEDTQTSYDMPASGETEVTEANAPGGTMDVVEDIIEGLGETVVTEDNAPGGTMDVDYEGETEVTAEDLQPTIDSEGTSDYWSDESMQKRIDDFEIGNIAENLKNQYIDEIEGETEVTDEDLMF